MINYTCNQLFLNDTDVPDEEVQKILKELNADVSYELVSDTTLVDVGKALSGGVMGTVILPGSGGDIYRKYVDIEGFEVVLIAPTRKLVNMSPRGLLISEEDQSKLEKLCLGDGEMTFCDDVIASGTTVNGISKNLGPKALNNLKISTLVLRDQNQLKKGNRPKVEAGITVKKEGGGYPRINTLSSLFLESKRAFILAGRQQNYGSRFTTAIEDLFTLS